jgi:hypothetical protein
MPLSADEGGPKARNRTLRAVGQPPQFLIEIALRDGKK